MVFKRNYLLLCSLILSAIIASFDQCVYCAINDDIIDDEDSDNDLIASNQSQDFNFDDKKADNGKTMSRELKQMYNWWSIEDICKDVKCKLNEYCVIKSKEVAVCVKRPKYFSTRTTFDEKKKSLKTNNNMLNKNNVLNNDDEEDNDDDYDDDDTVEQKSVYTKSDDSNLKLCTPCPVVKPLFICGSDNSTYSSVCRLDFHNCVHKTRVEYVCNGFCPCFKKTSIDFVGNSKKSRLEKTRNSINKHLSKLKQEKNNRRVFEKYDKQEKFYNSNKKYKLNKKLENNQYMHNLVLQNKKKLAKTNDPNKCTADDLKVMGTRLLEWFSVVIAEQQKKDRTESKKNSASRIPDCHKDVSYMFHHFDTNSDLKLSIKELYYLEHDENEHCLQPYLNQCDEDNDKYLSAYEWCTCFDTKSSPCSAAVQHLKKGILGAYMPQCDSDGFYKPTQCHASTGICWCVDKNGVEFLNSRRKGVPDCKALLNNARERSKLNDIDNDDEDDDDDDLDDGSGDDRSNQ